MKIKCIDDKNMKHSLTQNRTYDLLYEERRFVTIVDDCGNETQYRTERFEVVESEPPEDYTICDGLHIDWNYLDNDLILKHANDDFIYIWNKNEPTNYTLNYNEVVGLRDHLNEIITYMNKICYKQTKELTKIQIEELLGYKIKIVEG